MPLTDIQIRKAKPAEKLYKLTDGHRLYLVVKPNGTKLWWFQYRLDSKQHTYSIGVYPEISLAGARAERDQARDLVAKGIHPTHARHAERGQNIASATNTFRVVADEWLSEKKPHVSDYYYKQIKSGLLDDIYPSIGQLPLSSVTTSHVLDILTRVKKRGASCVAINLRQWISQIFLYAIVTQRADTDPAAPLKGFITRPEINHAQAMKPADIVEFMRRLSRFGGNRTTALAIRLMMLTFVRTNELRHAEWSEFDFERGIWSIPAAKMKMRRVHMVPLSTQALELLTELKRITGSGRYLFPNTRRPDTCMSGTTINRAIEYMGYQSATWTGHDWRATAQTQLLEMGFPEQHTEVQLAHAKKSKTQAAYNHAVYLPQRTEMMQSWADWLDKRLAEAQADPGEPIIKTKRKPVRRKAESPGSIQG